MDFRDLDYFVTVARTQNFSRAAEKLIVAQPTLSQTVARLEKAAGARLFHRLQHGLSLTPEGELFLAAAEQMLQLKNDLDAEMLGVAEGKVGRIHLGISYTFSRSLVPRALPLFAKAHPEVEVVIHTETSSLLEKMLVNGELDVAVLVETKKKTDLAYEVLFHEQILLAVSPDNPLADKGEEREDEDFPYLAPSLLHGQRFILSQEGMRLRDSAEAYFQAESIPHEAAVTTASISTAINLAANDVGIAFVPSSQAMENAEPALPKYFVTADTLADWKVCMAMKKSARSTPLLSAFVQAFKDAM